MKYLYIIFIVVLLELLIGCTHRYYDSSVVQEELDIAHVFSPKEFTYEAGGVAFSLSISLPLFPPPKIEEYVGLSVKDINGKEAPRTARKHMVLAGNVSVSFTIWEWLKQEGELDVNFHTKSGHSYQPYYLYFIDSENQENLHLWVVEEETSSVVYGEVPECIGTKSC